MQEDKNKESNLERESALIQEELVRQIHFAGRWSAVVEAWEALLKVRHMAESMIDERNIFFDGDKSE